MLNFCASNKIESDAEEIEIDQVNDAYEGVINGDVRFRLVIDLASLE